MSVRYRALLSRAVHCAFALALLLLAGAWPAAAQGRLDVTFQVDDRDYPTIDLYVSVTDASGDPVTDLVQDDFEVTEDGTPVELISFAGVGDVRPVDIVFVFDVTGSMRDEIDGVKETCVRFAERLSDSGRDYRLGLVTFLDVIENVYRSDGSLTDDVQEFKGWIERQRAHGGDDDPELALDALDHASQMTFREGSQRILILITDAPPHFRGDGTRFSSLTFAETVKRLDDRNMSVFAVAPELHTLPGAGLPSGNVYEQMTSQLGGRFYNISRGADFTTIIDDIGEAISTQYKLRYETPRPVPDGTLRDIQVHVTAGGVSGTGRDRYLEAHLLNVKSNAIVGLLFLLPLVALVVLPRFASKLPPFAPKRRQAPQASAPQPPAAYPPPAYPPPAGAPAPVAQAVCRECGRGMRVGARFCPHCGADQRPVPPAPASAAGAPPPARAPAQTTCPNCGALLRQGARFCSRCGTQIAAGG